MRKLIKGIIDFRRKFIKEYRDKFSKLAFQQSPDALFVACCDSRVVPNVFASSDPGDLFVLRNIGNLIPPYQNHSSISIQNDNSVSAAIEFSLLSLNVKDIIICGHSECGAMYSLMEKEVANPTSPALHAWLEYGSLTYERYKKIIPKNTDLTPCNLLSRINVLQQLDNLKTYPLVREYLQNNKLKIHGWWFDLATADVYHYNSQVDDFKLIDEKEAKILLDAAEF